MRDRVPGVIWFHMVEGTSTAKITEAIGINTGRSSRILYIIALGRKPRPITELSGNQLVRIWWYAVA